MKNHFISLSPALGMVNFLSYGSLTILKWLPTDTRTMNVFFFLMSNTQEIDLDPEFLDLG